MTELRPGTLGPPVPPEDDPVPADVIARARAIAPTLVPRQAETEQRTYYAPDVHETFATAGLYRLLVPRRYGGYELGAETFLRVAQELARGCPSTGWMYVFGAAHALAVGTLFEEHAQQEIFGSGHFICPATVAPSGHAERAPDGSWLVSGEWKYCSGAPYATHFMAHTMVTPPDGEPETLLFVAPRDQWTVVDDWGDQLGLRGSGSHGISMDQGRVPARFTLERTHLSQLSVTGGTPGRTLHGSPEYGGGPLSFMLLELGALAVGMAQGALDAYEQLMTERTTIYPPIVPRAQDPDYQLRYGRAVGRVSAAEAALHSATRQWTEMCVEGPESFTAEREWRLATVARETIDLAWRAVEADLFPTAGSSAVRAGQRLERVWRDMSMLHSHGGVAVVLASMASHELARARFDLA